MMGEREGEKTLKGKIWDFVVIKQVGARVKNESEVIMFTPQACRAGQTSHARTWGHFDP